MKKRNIIAAVVAFVILASLITTFFIVKKKKEIPPNPINTLGNTSGNLYNGGLFCEKGGYVYFSNSYDGGALYRMKPNEAEMEKLISTQTKLINVDDYHIYYFMSGSGSGEGFGYIINMTGVSKCDLDGSNAATLDKSNVDSLLLLGDYLIYDAKNDESTLSTKKYNLSTKKIDSIIDHKVTAACGYMGQLYYTDNIKDFNLYSYNPITDQNLNILNIDVYQPIYDGMMVYFIDIHDGYALASINLATGEKKTLDHSRTDMFNVSKSYIYYQTSGKNPQFKRIALDGTQEAVIKDGVYNSINITSQYVYFKEYNNSVQTFKIDLDGSLYVSEFTLAKNAANGMLNSLKKK